MVTPLDYYLHNSTFFTPEGRDNCVKQKEKTSRFGEAFGTVSVY
jgi:hypothetical protein